MLFIWSPETSDFDHQNRERNANRGEKSQSRLRITLMSEWFKLLSGKNCRVSTLIILTVWNTESDLFVSPLTRIFWILALLYKYWNICIYAFRYGHNIFKCCSGLFCLVHYLKNIMHWNKIEALKKPSNRK